MRSFRPLVYFWLAVAGLLGVTAIALLILGPPGPPRPAASAVAEAEPKPEPETKPALVASRLPHYPTHAAPAAATPLAEIDDPDPGLLEPSPESPSRLLPRIDAAGHKPSEMYAGAFNEADKHPRIALVLDGIGLDRGLSNQALHDLPPAIDIAFSAYTVPADMQKLSEAARKQGRECLVSIPMEPSGFPVVEEGDKMLLTGGIPAQNRLNLQWALSAVQGCVGATAASDGMAGERFAESRQAFGDVLAELDKRGLIYLDPRPGAPPPDSGHALPFVADLVVDRPTAPDEPASADAIDKNLASLERIASLHGSAIGLAGPPRAVLLERLAIWANGLAARGMVLAPLTAIPAPRPAAVDAAQ